MHNLEVLEQLEDFRLRSHRRRLLFFDKRRSVRYNAMESIATPSPLVPEFAAKTSRSTAIKSRTPLRFGVKACGRKDSNGSRISCQPSVRSKTSEFDIAQHQCGRPQFCPHQSPTEVLLRRHHRNREIGFREARPVLWFREIFRMPPNPGSAFASKLQESIWLSPVWVSQRMCHLQRRQDQYLPMHCRRWTNSLGVPVQSRNPQNRRLTESVLRNQRQTEMRPCFGYWKILRFRHCPPGHHLRLRTRVHRQSRCHLLSLTHRRRR